MELKPGYALVWGEPIGRSCGSGGNVDVTVTLDGKPVRTHNTCLCGRGCGNRDRVRDDWGYRDTDIEDIRAD